ncbi:S41 family peptidase [Adhaeribacter radiodurans]|uniref:S41 family peptidase n=1 Tax=Adhaeribacter radiodurans TaxID=2745197 RepID=A0A7L7LDN1_9BACT|nr:S41 family peptidase [Adhaeribacter radiodurans]QMU30645.1 S41 family peptidase [Adhaeribacter radiodurans]
MKKYLFSSYHKVIYSYLLLFLLAFSFGFTDRYFEIAKNLDTFASIYRQLNSHYVDEVSPADLVREGIDAMLGSLDPYTEYIPESDIEDFKMNYVSKQYAGIGISVFTRKDKIIVSEPYEGFSAQRADIRAGDEILSVNGISVKGRGSSSVSEMLKGQKDAPVKLAIKRYGEKQPLEKTVLREVITFNNVSYTGLLQDSIGYIKLDKFLENSAQEVKQSLLNLKRQHRINALVLDLRGNGGGIVQESVDIVNLFVEKGNKIVTQKAKIKDKDMVYKATLAPVDPLIPLVVLVDRGSASASEIVAGAIQDLDRGTIIGNRTFGKGLVQQTINLPYNSLLKVTVAKYYTPSGRCIQALDYAHRNPDGSVRRVSDSLMAEYKTTNGRSVYDGNGIYPDLVTKEKSYHNIAYSIISKSLHFDFATRYRMTHASIPSARSFNLSDTDFQEFTKYLSDKDYNYTTKSEKNLEELKSIAEKEKYFEDIKLEYNALKNKLVQNKKDDLSRCQDEIKEILESEIVSRYYFQKGRLETSFKTDVDVKEAIKVLTDKNKYVAILKGQGPYKVIGKPKMEALVNAGKSSLNSN